MYIFFDEFDFNTVLVFLIEVFIESTYTSMVQSYTACNYNQLKLYFLSRTGVSTLSFSKLYLLNQTMFLTIFKKLSKLDLMYSRIFTLIMTYIMRYKLIRDRLGTVNL